MKTDRKDTASVSVWWPPKRHAKVRRQLTITCTSHLLSSVCKTKPMTYFWSINHKPSSAVTLFLFTGVFLPVLNGFWGCWCPEFGHQDPDDVEQEDEVNLRRRRLPGLYTAGLWAKLPVQVFLTHMWLHSVCTSLSLIRLAGFRDHITWQLVSWRVFSR